ncbi:hypothetical protein FO519_000359 [Halicephalobus sp. NKZ332]|nr:hypothetical protein FO519_000359 [Halicephalobus sp. NKZ332]
MNKILQCPYTGTPIELPPPRGVFQDIIDRHSYSGPEGVPESSSEDVQKPVPQLIPFQLSHHHVPNNPRSHSIDFSELMDLLGMEIDRSFETNDESVSCRSVIRFLFALIFFILFGFQVIIVPPPPYKRYDSPPTSDNGPPTYEEV